MFLTGEDDKGKEEKVPGVGLDHGLLWMGLHLSLYAQPGDTHRHQSVNADSPRCCSPAKNREN